MDAKAKNENRGSDQGSEQYPKAGEQMVQGGTSDDVETEEEFLAVKPNHTEGAALLPSGAGNEETPRPHYR